MPSRNSINKPKHIGRKKPVHPNLNKKADVLTTTVVSKKRAKKNQRNLRYRQELLKQNSEDVDMDTESKTQIKKAMRAQKLLEFIPSEDVQMNAPSGQGTTLGGPAWTA